MAEIQYKTIMVNRTKTLANGESRTYNVKQRYKVKGYERADGTRKLKIELTAEQIADIKHLYALGVTKKKIKDKYEITQAKLDKILPVDK